jgi:hypothetical protein
MNVDPRLGEVVLQDAGGRSVKLGSLWTERPAALVFVRHFG